MKAKTGFEQYDQDIFEFILDNIPDAITVIDIQCKTVFFNKTSQQFFGVKKEFATETNFFFYQER